LFSILVRYKDYTTITTYFRHQEEVDFDIPANLATAANRTGFNRWPSIK
jgi:hypothetical protein